MWNLIPSQLSISGLLAQAAAKTDLREVLLPVSAGFRNNPSGLIWTIVLVGFGTAALVQFAKDFFGVRSRFHRRWVHDWVERRSNQVTATVTSSLFGDKSPGSP